MNNKSQFFIVSIVLFSIALTSIVYLLTIPSELSQKDMQSQLRDYDDFYSSLKTLRQLSMSINTYWPKSQTSRLSFEAVNTKGGESSNQLYLMNLNIDDSANSESFYLSNNGKKMSFSISQSGAKDYLISFKDSIPLGESGKYYLFFNKLSDPKTYLMDEKKISDYYETIQAINYESNSYKAMINKSSGELLSVRLIESDYELTSLKSNSNNNPQSSCSANYSFMSYSNNVLSINFTCMLGTVTLTQKYDFHPEFIIVSQEFNVLYYNDYNLSLIAESNLDSLATSVSVNESLIQPTLTMHDSKYVSLFHQDYGVLFIGNDSMPYVITSPNITLDYRINSSILSPGTYYQKIIIVPYYNNYNYSLSIANNYFFNPLNSFTLSKNEFLNYFKSSFLNILSNSFNSMLFFINNTYSNNYLASTSADSKYAIAEFSLKNQQLLNKTLTDESGSSLRFSYITKNYMRNSTFPIYLCNNDSMNVHNTTYEFMKMNGSEIIVTINTTGEINAKLYDYSGQLLTQDTFSVNSQLSVSNALNGVYRLVISSDNACFKVSVNSPLISALSPIILNASENMQLFFSSDSSFQLTKTNITNSPMVTLSNALGTLVNSSNNFSYNVSNDYYYPVNYYLNITAGKFYLNNGLNFGAQESYLPTTYDVKGLILKDYNAVEYYYLNDSQIINYCVMNYSSNAVNNTGYSIDFDSNEFVRDSNNWASSELFNIDGLAFDFKGLVLDSALLKSYELDSANASMIISLINDSNLIMIDFENAKKSFDLRINLRVNGDADNYLNFNSNPEYYAVSKSIDSERLLKGYNFIAKNDSGNYFAAIFDADDLKQSSSAIIIHNDYLQLSLSKYCKKIYLYFTDDYSDLLKTVDGLNNNIIISNELLTYDYSYTSQNFNSAGTILG
ncbi:MAG: T9SS type A sorting domain-containing protein [Candidatus Nanoarchaeia archaeon]|jgi:hypothetical protein